MSVRRTVLAGLLVALAAGPAPAGTVGEGMHRGLSAVRAARAPAIDGDLSEPAWAAAPVSADFTQTYPADGAPPSFQTEVRVLYDDRALYIGVLCHDPDPAHIAARLARRDDAVESDHVALVLDPRHDHDTGYWFWLNAAGVQADAQLHDDLRASGSWDAVWRGAARVHAGGWTAELAIPWSVLRFPRKPLHTWGFNLSRFVARTKETAQWVRVPPSVNANLSRAGHITGLAGLDPPRALELRPFAVVSATVDLPRGGGLGAGGGATADTSLSAGLDAKYAVAGDLTLDLTVLPDFGQVEADPAVLNLSTFETFFPEKRPFFLENADLFGTDVRLFHSRRIGQPIWGAARLTGRVGRRLTIAALDAVTGPTTETIEADDGSLTEVDATPVRNYAALRGKYSLGVSNYVGFMATSLVRAGAVRDPAADHDAVAGSVDGRWVSADGAYRAFMHAAVTARLNGPPEPIARADGSLQHADDLGFGAMAGAAKPGGEHWVGMAIFNTRSPRFDANDVGFETEWDLHRGFAELSYREQRPFGPFQSGAARVNANAMLGWDGLVQDFFIGAGASATTRGFRYHGMSLGWRPGHTYTTRETSDGARFERAHWMWIDTTVSSDSRGWLRGSAAAGAGASPSSAIWNLWSNLSVAVRPGSPLEISLAADAAMTEDQLRVHHCTATDGADCSKRSPARDYVLGDLDHGSLSLTGRINWALSTRLSLQGWAQLFSARGRWLRYRHITDQLGAEPHLDRAELAATDYDGDDDGDGIKDDDFAWSALHANLVLRWEFSPGAALTAVYTRAQRADRALAGERPLIGFAGLGRSPTEEIFLVKLGWFWTR